MARSGGPTVGLDIGSRTIKVAEVVSNRGGVSVRALGTSPTPEGAMENNVIVDPKLLGEAVKKLLKECGVSTKASVSSVSGQGALVVRVIEVPKMSDAELAETMKWEVERHVPFAANEVIMDFQRIERTDTPPDAQNMEVLLAVAQQDMIDRHVEMLFAAGLSPVAIDVEPLAAARCLIGLSPDPYGKRTVVIVNVGASNTDIGIYRDGILSFPRTLPLAGDAMSKAIAAQMGVSLEDAEALKSKYGEVLQNQMAQPQQPASEEGFLDFSMGEAGETGEAEPAEPQTTPFDFSGGTEFGAEPADTPEAPVASVAPSVPAPVPAVDPTKAQVFAAIAPTLTELLTELKRSLEYYRGRSVDGQIDEVLLCGGTAKLKGLDTFLSDELGIPTRVADPFQYVKLASRNLSSEYLADVAPSFAVAVGLGARDFVAVPATAGGGRKRGRK